LAWSKKRFISYLSVILIASTAISVAQGGPALEARPNNVGIALPSTTGLLGQIDAPALDEVRAHLAAIGGAAWEGMQAVGTLIDRSQNPTAYAVTLANLGGDRFRLDTQTKKGQVSTRIHGLAGKVQVDDRPAYPLGPDTAAVGIFPFEIPRVLTSFSPGATLTDHGLVGVDGTQLHRITVEKIVIGNDPVTNKRNTVAIDFYFDPKSHLLIKSATSGSTDGDKRVHCLTVVTYSDYRIVNTSLIPFRYTETVDGGISRILQLSSVQLSPALGTAYFEF
jgi:hypothetical protein